MALIIIVSFEQWRVEIFSGRSAGFDATQARYFTFNVFQGIETQCLLLQEASLIPLDIIAFFEQCHVELLRQAL